MKLRLLLLGCVLIFLNSQAQETPLYVGTYTNGDSEGIYQLQFNTETGELSNKQLAAHIDSPSFLAFSPNKSHLYSVNESKSGYVSSFKVEDNGSLSLLTRLSSYGTSPCHVSVNQSNSKVAVSNYSGGTVSLYPISENGSLKDASQVFNHNSKDQKSHAHSAKFYNNNLFVADLGRNSIYQYRLNENDYQLKSSAIVKINGNPGPRHFTVTKDSQFMYVINEYGASVTSIKKMASGGFEQIDEDSTLDENYKGQNACADIHLSKDERFVYGSNRGENTIAVFKRDVKRGTLEKIQTISVHGNWPRNFTIDPTGKFVLVANQKSHNISVFKIDSNTGKLTFLHSTDLPSPVCLLF